MEAELNYLNTQSQLLLTLKKQIQAMYPLRLSYENLKKYHEKITADLQTLIHQHDHAMLSLSKNNQVLCHLVMKTDEQRTALLNLLREKQNQLAKLILDNKNTTQKHQSLTNKLKLQQDLTEQSESHQRQLLLIFQNLSSQIQILSKTNTHCCQTNNEMIKESEFLNEEIKSQKLRKQRCLSTNQTLKSQITKLNEKNECISQENRNLQENIQLNQKQIQLKIKLNRQHKQSEIELIQTYQKIQNQKQYQITLLETEEQAKIQLQAMLIKLQTYLNKTQQEKSEIQKENIVIQKQIQAQTLKFKQNQTFLTSSSAHLKQLKQTNQTLLKKMQDYCLQDRQIENILLRKTQILQNCYRKMNLTGIFNQKSINLTNSTTLKKQSSYKGSIIDKVAYMSSSKNWSMCKQNSSS